VKCRKVKCFYRLIFWKRTRINGSRPQRRFTLFWRLTLRLIRWFAALCCFTWFLYWSCSGLHLCWYLDTFIIYCWFIYNITRDHKACTQCFHSYQDLGCYSSTKQTSSSYHWNVTCSRHDKTKKNMFTCIESWCGSHMKIWLFWIEYKTRETNYRVTYVSSVTIRYGGF
jgi:hypothetical protein